MARNVVSASRTGFGPNNSVPCSPPVLQHTGQNWLQAIFGIVGKLILWRIIMQVAPLIPARGKMLQTKI